MPFNTITVSAAVTPTVIATWLSHYFHPKRHREKPTARISYDEGLHLIRRFLHHASHHTLEDFQAFTARRVPPPPWVRVDDETIPDHFITSAAEMLISQLGQDGILRVGGKKWWQWRGHQTALKAEWIEMRSDYKERSRRHNDATRVMLYVHGGAFFFGSVDTHRYQIQRHARKLKARVFARSTEAYHILAQYRLAPQFPFPCGLQDCIAAYLFLLEHYEPHQIILAGDSAGAGLALSVLVTMRDRGRPLPAGAILISPWVDLTGSFPSLADETGRDYIPPHGFQQRPSVAWPPPTAGELKAIAEGVRKKLERSQSVTPQSRRDHIKPALPEHVAQLLNLANAIPGLGNNLDIERDGEVINIGEQIHMYATNELLSHPLVSPVLQPSLGGLPPLYILVGGGEMLHDEQIYLAHKAADPASHLPSDVVLGLHDPNREIVSKFAPTYVQLQVWDDLCHVAPTLSFTPPAKHMYRAIAQFGTWALARAQESSIGVRSEDPISGISSCNTESVIEPHPSVGRAGDPLPRFDGHMIRQRVDIHGKIYPLQDPSTYSFLQRSPSEIGVPQPGPLRKWSAAKKEWDKRYEKERSRVRRRRIELFLGIKELERGEFPPPSSLAMRHVPQPARSQRQTEKNHGMAFWSFLGSRNDAGILAREDRLENSE